MKTVNFVVILWQDPYEYNARYAVVMGGYPDSDSASGQPNAYHSFKFDLEEMYNALKKYNLNKDNIYYGWWNKGANATNELDGDATYNYDINYNPGSIRTAIKNIGTKITKNDLFLFFGNSHGEKSTSTDGYFETYNPDPDAGNNHITTMKYSDLATEVNTDIGTRYARCIFVIAASYAGASIWPLRGENRIIITPSPWDVSPGGWKFGGLDYDYHMKFLHSTTSGEGFTVKLSSICSILTAYNSGYDSAIVRKTFWPFPDDSSVAQIEDSGDGIPHNKGSMSDDGTLSSNTWL